MCKAVQTHLATTMLVSLGDVRPKLVGTLFVFADIDSAFLLWLGWALWASASVPVVLATWRIFRGIPKHRRSRFNALVTKYFRRLKPWMRSQILIYLNYIKTSLYKTTQASSWAEQLLLYTNTSGLKFNKSPQNSIVDVKKKNDKKMTCLKISA